MSAQRVEAMTCSDCPAPVSLNAETLAKGSSVREPGEPLCQSCSATRIKMVRELDKIPNSLSQIQALRMAGIPNVPRLISKESRY